MKVEHSARIFSARALVYIGLTTFLSLLADHIFFEGFGFSASLVFLFVSLATLGQALVVFRPVAESSLFALFLTDAVVSMMLVRASGSSSSPFLVLFPLLSLAGAVTFQRVYAVALTSLSILFMSLAVGFGVAILGNAAAILATGFLGVYLMQALTKTDKALSASEVARRRLENLQKAILTNIPSGLMSVDSQGRIIQVNRVGARILGLSETEILSRPLEAILPHIHSQVTKLNTLVPVLDYQESNPDRPMVKYRRASTGEELRLGYSVARLTDPEDGSVLGSLVVFQDLTSVMKLEDNLRLTEKLAAVGKLAAGIAHEIRNPLAGISGSAQLLSSLKGLSDEDARLLAIIQRESSRLDALITDFLEYVRPGQGKVERVDLGQTVEKLFESIKVNAKWQELKCGLSLQKPGEPVFVSGDANRITQVLMNFVLNSGQAHARRVEIAIGPGPQLELRDDGTGIPPEIRSRIFEPFFTTKERGTGLGLATSYKVLEAMDAKVEVISPIPEFTEKGGTMIRIRFKGAEA